MKEIDSLMARSRKYLESAKDEAQEMIEKSDHFVLRIARYLDKNSR